MTRRLALGILLFAGLQTVQAEPYLAVRQGLKCVACHTSPSGGGKRNAYGNYFAQRELPARTIGGTEDAASFWSGEVIRYLAVGGDVRGGWNRIDVPGQPHTTDTDLEEVLAYVDVRLIPDVLTIYVDARLAPNDPDVREQYAKLSVANGRWWLRAGEFFLPYGLRIQDDAAFIREVGGINYNTPDTGLELGWERRDWSAQFAVTRGTAGGPEIDSGKQYSLRVSHVRSRWRLGGSLNFNDTDLGDRRMLNVFAGLQTGRVSWLGELDYIVDEGSPTGRRKTWAGLLEANIAAARGHNVRIAYEFLDPDDAVPEDQRNRYSLVWEYFPIQFVQARAGYRKYRGIPQNPAQNREQLFLELHLLF